MLVQRTMQQSLRRFAVQQPSFSRTALSKISKPASIILLNNHIQSRSAATQNLKQDEGYEILVQQRLKRPTSPHLGIYKLQISSTLSALNRITGCILSGGFYAFGLAYVAAPLFGWHLESGAMAAVFASWPALVKVGLKFGIAMPFTFHSWNGIRHLIWDTGKNFSNKTVIQTGWLVVGLSVVSAAALAVI